MMLPTTKRYSAFRIDQLDTSRYNRFYLTSIKTHCSVKCKQEVWPLSFSLLFMQLKQDWYLKSFHPPTTLRNSRIMYNREMVRFPILSARKLRDSR